MKENSQTKKKSYTVFECIVAGWKIYLFFYFKLQDYKIQFHRSTYNIINLFFYYMIQFLKIYLGIVVLIFDIFLYGCIIFLNMSAIFILLS